MERENFDISPEALHQERIADVHEIVTPAESRAILNDEIIRERVESIYRDWLSQDPGTRGQFNTRYVTRHSQGGGLSSYLRRVGTKVEDYLSSDMLEHWDRMEKQEWTDEKIRDELQRIYQLWKLEGTHSKQQLNANFIKKHNPALFASLRYSKRQIEQYLPEEALQVWTKRTVESWDENKVRDQLEQVFQGWLAEDPETRKQFTPEYIFRHNGSLHAYIRSKYQGDFEKYLSAEAKQFWQQRSREKPKDLKDLPQVDVSTNQYIDPNGVIWAPKGYFENLTTFSPTVLNPYCNHVSSISGRNTTGHSTRLYNVREMMEALNPLITLPRTNPETNIYVDANSKQWAPKSYFTKMGINGKTLDMYYIEGVDSLEGVDQTGHKTSLYDLSTVMERLRPFLSLPRVDSQTNIYVDPEGQEWINREVYVDSGLVTSYSIVGLTNKLEHIKGRAPNGREINLYKKAELEKIIQALQELPKVDATTGLYVDSEGVEWAPQSFFIKEKISNYILASLLKDITYIKGRGDIKLYPRETVEEKLKPYLALPQVDLNTGIYIDPDGKEWVTLGHFTESGEISYTGVESLLSGISSQQGRNKAGVETQLYDKQGLKMKVQEFLSRPQIDKVTKVYTDSNGEEWVSKQYFVREKLVSRASNLNPYLDGVRVLDGRGPNNYPLQLYNKTEVIDRLEKSGVLARYADMKQKRQANTEREALEEFVRDIEENDTFESGQFRTLVSLFGAAKAADILYRYRPQYRGIPIDYVRSTLSEYLGDILITKPPFNPDDIEHAIDFLGEPQLQEGLQEVIKDSCLTHLNEQKRQDIKASDKEVIDAYIDFVEQRTEQLDSPIVSTILKSVREYYRSVFEDFAKPDRMVETLREGRPFPDTYQRINMKEIAEKQRMLIADEMGIGKSASAILAKETLHLGPGLVVAPSNVIATWQRYLSDEVGPNGEQVGYFKPGQTPAVLVVESFEVLQQEDLSHYEYVLISQERLSANYTETLLQHDWDMLIIDEVHKLKNVREGKRASCGIQLAEKVQGEGKYVALLSGTPVPNKIDDIAVSLKLLYPERFKDTANKELVRQILTADLLDLRQLLIPRMQMKSLAESVEMPPLHEEVVDTLELSEVEQEIYEVLLEEDELEAFEKLRILRQFLINPAMLDILPGIQGTKCRAVEEDVQRAFKENDKVALFFNGYVDGVLRGDKSVLDQMQLPEGVTTRIIDGKTPPRIRNMIEQELRTSDEKILLAVSGQTADVGVDYSAAERYLCYNEPWSSYEARQQRARVYRYGRTEPLTATTYIVKGTLEEGIHAYIQAKERAVEKLLHGIPITELEKEILEKGEEQTNPNLEVNPELAKYYTTSFKHLMRIFSATKEIGEEKFLEFLDKYAKDYAEGYADLGSRSYQANANRVSGTVIDRLVQESGQNPEEIVILDPAAGPEMLRTHIAEPYQHQVFSLDINQEHFRQREPGHAGVASFAQIPVQDKTVDYVNLCLALHYTGFRPLKGNYERLQVLTELNRVLKEGGKAVLNMVYSMDVKNQEKFEEIVRVIGFEIVHDHSGEVVQGDNYWSHLVVLEKRADIDISFEELTELLSDDMDGLKFRPNKQSLKDSRKIIRQFSLNGQDVPVNFNPRDYEVLQEEEGIIALGHSLSQEYGGLEHIPAEAIINNQFIRFYNGKRYVLFQKLTTSGGYVLIK